ncbi:sensor histidine kinase [Ferrovibrio xuzhouensis]|uniref:histidine kinase n=1 Tax=Ferrovibrio xuzhouensis TaxID=1576914 RepID=A0ABV7VAT0_9PROT
MLRPTARSPLQLALLMAGFAVIAVTSISSIWLTDRINGVSDEVAHSLQVNAALVTYIAALRRAESGQRGYLVTGRQSYLDDYRIGLQRNREIGEQLAGLIAEDPPQREQFLQLQPLVHQKLVELERVVAMKEAGQGVSALALLETDEGLRVMNEISGIIRGMLDEEMQASDNSQRLVDRLNPILFIVNFAGSLTIAALAILALRLIRRNSRDLLSAHAALEQSADRLALANRALEQANTNLEHRVAERTADLSEANEEIQRFAFVVSHDMRTPLVNVMGFTGEIEALKEEIFAGLPADDPARQRQKTELGEAIGFIKASIGKMDRLINAVLRLSRAGQREFHPQEIDLRSLLRGLADQFAHRAQAADCRIEIDDLPQIVSDRLAIEQIFSNLLDNAVKYLRPGVAGEITIRAEDAADTVAIRVGDNGRGIDPRDHERIFELFRRSGDPDQPGEGIGLAHVRIVVRRIGGSIRVSSTPATGTIFTVTLPKQWKAYPEASGRVPERDRIDA